MGGLGGVEAISSAVWDHGPISRSMMGQGADVLFSCADGKWAVSYIIAPVWCQRLWQASDHSK